MLNVVHRLGAALVLSWRLVMPSVTVEEWSLRVGENPQLQVKPIKWGVMVRVQWKFD